MKISRLFGLVLAVTVGVAGASAARAADDFSGATRRAQWDRLAATAPEATPAPVDFHRCRLTPRDVRYERVADDEFAPTTVAPNREERYLDTSCWPPGCGPCAPQNACEFRFGLTAWFPGADGTITQDGTLTNVDYSWSDWFDNLEDFEFGSGLFATYRWKCWTFGGSWLGVKLGDSVPIMDFAGNQLESELSANIFKLWIGYDLFRRSMSKSNCWPCLTAQVYGGARIYVMKLESTLPRPAGPPQLVDQTQEWGDLLIGTNLRLDLSPRWALILDADAGGFGAGSNFSWHVDLGAEWKALRWFALQAGWAMLDVDYTEGGGADKFGYNLMLSGPYLRLVFTF